MFKLLWQSIMTLSMGLYVHIVFEHLIVCKLCYLESLFFSLCKTMESCLYSWKDLLTFCFDSSYRCAPAGKGKSKMLKCLWATILNYESMFSHLNNSSKTRYTRFTFDAMFLLFITLQPHLPCSLESYS